MKDMAKKKNKKQSPGGGNDTRQTDRSIDLSKPAPDDSDSDLNIDELFRKYMPEYRDGDNTDGPEGELYPEAAQTGNGGKDRTAGSDQAFDDLFASLGLNGDDDAPAGTPFTADTAADSGADADLDAALSDLFSVNDSTDADPAEETFSIDEPEQGISGGADPDADPDFSLSDLFSADEPAVDAEPTEGGVSSGFADRIAATLESDENEPAEQTAAGEGGGLFSRILKSAEEVSDQADSADEGSSTENQSSGEGGVFSRIRRTVEDEESRREEQMRSDEELLSALDAAFAYSPEDNGEGGDFQIPVTDTPAWNGSDDVISEYDIEPEAPEGQHDAAEPAGFTVSDTNTGLSESDRNLDFVPDPAQIPDYAAEPAPESGKPVGKEMTDEQVMALFGEVKPQKKRFSLFRRNKKPKAVTADDEFIPDEEGFGFGSGQAPDVPGQPTDAADRTGYGDQNAPSASEPQPAWDGGKAWEQPAQDAGFAEVPAEVQNTSAASAEDDTDALIAEATAALFGRGSDTGYETGGQLREDVQYAEELGGEDAFAGSGVDDEIEALWKQASAAVDAGETDGSFDMPAFDPGTFAADTGDTEEKTAEPAPDTGVSSGWARFTEKAMQTADSEPFSFDDSPNNGPAADQMLEDAAAALTSAAQEHNVAVSEEMGTAQPAPIPQQTAESRPKQPESGSTFVKQSRRSAANLSDEELLQWAAETLAENQTSHDFGPATDYTAEPRAEEHSFVPAPGPMTDVGEEIPDVSAFEFDDASGVTADSAPDGSQGYPLPQDNGSEAEKPGGDSDQTTEPSGEGTSWHAPETPYTEEEFDPTDINLMVAFDLDNGKNGQAGKAKALGDKLAARQQNRDTAVRLDRPEFVDRTQIPSIRKEYEKHSLSLFIRLLLCVGFGIALFLFENIQPVTKLLTGTGMQFSGFLDPRVYPGVYAMVSLQLMLLCCLCAYEEIIEGVKAVFRGIPKPESMTGLLAVAGILYSAVIAHVTESPNEPKMFNFVVALACFMTLMSAVYQNKREMMNFRIVSSRKRKHIVRRLKDDESELESRAFAETEDACDVMKIEKTDFIDGFFARLQKPDQTTGVFMMFVMGATVLLSVVIGIVDRIKGGTSADVARTIYESLLMMAPLSVFISFSYPFYRANLTARDYDSAIIGETSLEEYSNASIISFDDKNVFPSLSVKVQNVRIYNNARIDRILYYASSVFAYAGGPLQDVFEDVTKDLGTSANVKIFETEDDFLATQVDGVNIIFGGCEKLRSRGFVIDDEAAEDDVDLSDELSIMYMFRENKLVAKMYIKYEMDPDIDSILKQFSGNGLYACVRTFDPNINEDMVSKKLSMKKMPLKIVRYANLDEVATYEAKVDSGLVTCGQQKSLLQVIGYCGKVLRTKKTHIALSVLAILVSAAIALILELSGLLSGMNPWVVTLYQLVWLVPTMITSRVFIR